LLLILWRFFTVGFGVLVGGYFLGKLYGWPAFRRLIKGGPGGTATSDGDPPPRDSVERAGRGSHI